jgi:hypothetical protein
MSYDLSVYARSLPNDLRAEWQAALAASGLVVELQPDFDPANQAGYLAWKLQPATPEAFRYASLYSTKAVEAGFELTIRPADIDLDDWKTAAPEVLDRLEEAEHAFSFSNPHGCAPADFRLQWFAAATLARLTDGVLQDPQEDRSFTGKAALAEAEFQADQFEEGQRDDWTASTAFEAW